jgi:hypothetical protein
LAEAAGPNNDPGNVCTLHLTAGGSAGQPNFPAGGIVIGSTISGIIAGILIGVFARKVHSLALGIVFGLGVGLLLAFIVDQMQHGYYFQIMLPGGMVGLIVGYATQRYGHGPTSIGQRLKGAPAEGTRRDFSDS